LVFAVAVARPAPRLTVVVVILNPVVVPSACPR
jgi:hypothetical protein